jgi:hypothetical protein
LRHHIEQGGSVARAVSVFKRTEQSLRAHARDLGIRFPTIRELRDKAVGADKDAD